MCIKVSFLGLGVMGFPMAHYLSKKGYEVCVYNRTLEKAKKWVNENGGVYADTPSNAVEGADIVFCCVGNDDDLRAVCIENEGAFHNMKKDAVFIDCTTASANVAKELNAIANEWGFAFLDAPVSGGQAGAESGQLTVMVGGDEEAFNKSEDVIYSFAKAVKYMGKSGSGQLTKMVNQICIAGLVQGLSEGLYFAQNAGLDGEKVIEAISKGAAQSWQMENRYKTMLNDEFDFGFAVEWMRKDLGICLDEARKSNITLPVTALVDHFYQDVQKMGGNRWDTSSLIARLKK